MDELEKDEAAFSRLLGQAPPEDPARAEHRDALRASLGGLRCHPAKPDCAAPWKRIFHHGREIMRRPLPRLLVAAACLAIFALWFLVPGQQPAAQAFNMFAKAIVEAKSATFEMEANIEGQARLKAKCFYLAPGKMRQELSGTVNIMDLSTGKNVSLHPAQKTAVVMNLKNVQHEPGKPQVNNVFEQLREMLAEGAAGKDGEYERLGEKEIDGHRARSVFTTPPPQRRSPCGATQLPACQC